MEHLPRQKVGIVVGDVGNLRQLETIAASLDLESAIVDVADLKADHFGSFELVIADEAVARELRPIVTAEQMEREQINR